MAYRIGRAAYADMFGPTTGDKVRLGGTDILIEVERDATILVEEVKFGGGTVIRDGMGQSQLNLAQGAADTGITIAMTLAHSGLNARKRVVAGRRGAVSVQLGGR